MSRLALVFKVVFAATTLTLALAALASSVYSNNTETMGVSELASLGHSKSEAYTALPTSQPSVVIRLPSSIIDVAVNEAVGPALSATRTSRHPDRQYAVLLLKRVSQAICTTIRSVETQGTHNREPPTRYEIARRSGYYGYSDRPGAYGEAELGMSFADCSIIF